MNYKTKLKKFMVMLMIMIVGLATVLPSGMTADAATGKAVQKVTLKIGNKNVTKKTKSMYIGSTATLKVKVTPTAAKKKITYKSSRKNVAVVNSKGRITAKRAGTTKITVTVTGKDNVRKKTYVKIRVKKRPVSKITLNKTSMSLYTGSSYTLKATVYPKKATNKKVSWISSNKNVAVVSSTGKVTAKNPGTAVITVKAKDGSRKQRTCKVTVRKKPVDITGIQFMESNNSNLAFMGRIKVTFSDKVKLNKSNFTVRQKSTAAGTLYHENLRVHDVVSTDDKTYIVLMDNWCEIGKYIQVTVSGITGKNQMAVYVKGNKREKNQIQYAEAGNKVYKNISSNEGMGYCKYQLISGTLADGLTLHSLTGEIEGVPNTAGCTTAVIRETDELGNYIDITYTLYVYDARHIYVADEIAGENGYEIFEGADYNYILATLQIYGGSGSFNVKLSDEDKELFTYSKSGDEISVRFKSGKAPAAGVYEVNFTFKDANDASIVTKGVVKVIVTKGNCVSVKWNNPPAANTKGIGLCFINKSTGDSYYTYFTFLDDTNVRYLKTGSYKVYAVTSVYETEPTEVLIADNLVIEKTVSLTYEFPESLR